MSRSIAVALLAVAVSACGAFATSQVPFVDLSQRQELPVAAESEVAPLRIAVAAVLSPEGNIDSYAGLAAYLGDRLGRPAELIQRRTYAEVNDLIAAGEVDLAFVCTSAYVAGHDRSEMELLVIPEVNGESVYYSVIIVPTESAATSITDLRGKVFAFTDPMSHSGRVYPSFLLQELGETADTFFSRSFFTYSHDRAIDAVSDGIADGAAVDSLVLEYAIAQDPAHADRIKTIHRSPAFGIPPVVVPTELSPRLRAELEELLLNLDTDPAGPQILAQLGIDRFVHGEDSAYDGVRLMVEATGIGR
jgi:phosphonate transport system substrate-binding protein